MNKKYISLAIVMILALVVGVYKHMEGLTQTVPHVPGSEVLGIKDDLKISNQIVNFTEESGDFIKITYKYVISHAGNYVAQNVVARNWFTDAPENTYEVLNISSNSGLNINPAFDGASDTNILVGENVMAAKSSAEVFVTVRLNYKERSLKFISYVDVAGKSGEEGANSSATNGSTNTSSKTSTSSSPSTSKPSSTTSSQPSTTTSRSSSSAVPVVIDYNFTGLKGTAGGNPATTLTIGHNHGVRLIWSNVGTNCARSSVPANQQWMGSWNENQGYKDIMNLTQETTFTLNCGGTIHSVVVKVNPPKPSSSSSTSAPSVPGSSSSSSDPIEIPVTSTSSSGNVGNGEILGLYDAAQVTFSLPRNGSVAGAVSVETGGKDQ